MFEYAEGEGPDLWLSGKRFRPAWPKLFNLRSDPFEYGDQSGLYLSWYGERMFAFVPMQQVAGRFLRSMLEYPPSQAPGSLGIEAVQIGIILVMFPLLALLRRRKGPLHVWTTGLITAGVTVMGLIWLVQRVASG